MVIDTNLTLATKILDISSVRTSKLKAAKVFGRLSWVQMTMNKEVCILNTQSFSSIINITRKLKRLKVDALILPYITNVIMRFLLIFRKQDLCLTMILCF
jgi:hypothetical protein